MLHGTLAVTAGGASVSGNNSATLTLSGTEAQINATLATLSYQGGVNFNGSDTLTVLSTDSSASTDTDTVNITVNPVNDAPTVAHAIADQGATKGTQFTFPLPANTFNDVDGDALVYSATLSTGAALPSWLHFDAATQTFSGTPGNSDVGTVTVKVTATDPSNTSASDSFDIIVSNSNTAPVNTVPGPQTVNEDTALAFTGGSTIAVHDVDGNLASTQLSVLHGTLAVTAGGASVSGNNSATLTLSGTEAQINATLATLSYQGGVNFNGSDTLTVLSTDSSASTDTDTVNITVNPVNDAPTVAHAIADQGATKGTQFTFPLPANTFNDVDGDALVYSATLSTGAALPSWLHFDAATQTFSGTPGNSDVGTVTVKVTATDPSNTSASDSFDIIVSNSNTAPVNTVPGPQTVNEDTALAFTGGSTIAVHDVDGNLASTQLSVLHGTLAVTAGGASVSGNNSATLTLSGTEAQINATLATLSYQGGVNFNGSDTLTVLSTDSSASTDTDTVNITVNPVNDAPVNTVPGPQTVNEDTALAFTGGSTIAVHDVDGNLASTQLSVLHGTLAVTAGGASVSGNNSATLTLSGTEAQINATLATLSYQGGVNFNGSDTLTVLSTDSSASTDTDTVNITVNPVNDAPVNTVPGPQTVNEDTALAFTGGSTIAVHDVDGNLASTQLSVLHGTLAVTAGGASVSGNNSATLTLSGTEAQINATLATLSYQGGVNFNGSDTLTVLSTDSSASTDTDTVNITVNPVNDAPVISGMTTGTVHEDDPFDARSVSNQLTGTDPDAGDSVQLWTVQGGTTPQAAQYSFKIDEFKLSRPGNVTLFDDTFADGVPPPNAPSPPNYLTNGSFTETNANGGQVVMDSAHAVSITGVGTSTPLIGQFATLPTDISGNTSLGLKLQNDFTVEGTFDLTSPTDLRDAYGIALTDATPGATRQR